MSLIDLYDIEVSSISRTIQDYTVENFIQTYSNQLTKLDFVRDHDKLLYIVNELVDWYKGNIDSILTSKFVMNKQEHVKSYELLCKFLDKLRAD